MCRSFSRRISSSDLKAAMPPPMIRVTLRAPRGADGLRGRYGGLSGGGEALTW